MALFSVLIGGMAGFASFLTSLLLLDAGLVGALAVYFGVGSITSLLFMSAGLAHQALRPAVAAEYRTQGSLMEDWLQDAIIDTAVAQHIKQGAPAHNSVQVA